MEAEACVSFVVSTAGVSDETKLGSGVAADINMMTMSFCPDIGTK
jgi:hypothetical protein